MEASEEWVMTQSGILYGFSSERMWRDVQSGRKESEMRESGAECTAATECNTGAETPPLPPLSLSLSPRPSGLLPVHSAEPTKPVE